MKQTQSSEPEIERASSPSLLSQLVDSDSDPGDSEPELHGELRLKSLATRMAYAISTYIDAMRAFSPGDSIDEFVKLVLTHGNAVIGLAFKVFDQGRLVQEYCIQVTEDARQATDLAQQILVHCNRPGLLDYGHRNREVRSDVRLRCLAQDMSDAIWLYNELLEANPPSAELHEQIQHIDVNLKDVVTIAVEKYDVAVHAGKLCRKEKKEARGGVVKAKGVLKFWNGDGS